ncbi:unnamed protein product, partial [Discosporangium mesarthrocarpum]
IRDLLRTQGLLVDDTMANTRFLRSLGPEYDVEVRTLLIQDDPSWSDIERAVRTRHATLMESGPRRRATDQAFTMQPGRGRGRGGRPGQFVGSSGRGRFNGDSRGPTCWFCHARGHMAHACPTRKCTACGETGHGPSRCPKQKVMPTGYTVTATGTKPAGKYTALAATEMRVDGFVEWIADSGATWHMTNEITGLYDFVSTTEDTFVEAANG